MREEEKRRKISSLLSPTAGAEVSHVENGTVEITSLFRLICNHGITCAYWSGRSLPLCIEVLLWIYSPASVLMYLWSCCRSSAIANSSSAEDISAGRSIVVRVIMEGLIVILLLLEILIHRAKSLIMGQSLSYIQEGGGRHWLARDAMYSLEQQSDFGCIIPIIPKPYLRTHAN